MANIIEKTARERIIQTALDLFYRQGYLATGINQIISESQVAKASFYAHFPSKEALCLAYLQARHQLWMSWLRERVEKEKTARGRLLAVFAFLKKWMKESGFRGCAFLNIASEIPSVENDLRNEVIKHKDELRKYLRNIIAAAIESGGSPAGLDASETTRIIYVLIEGAIVASQNYNATWPIDSAREAAEKLMNL